MNTSDFDTSIKNHKAATVLVAIGALAGVLGTSTSAIGSGHIALAANIKVFNNKAHNVYKQTQMKSKCVKPLVQTLQFQAYATRLRSRRLPVVASPPPPLARVQERSTCNNSINTLFDGLC